MAQDVNGFRALKMLTNYGKVETVSINVELIEFALVFAHDSSLAMTKTRWAAKLHVIIRTNFMKKLIKSDLEITSVLQFFLLLF